MTIRVSCKDLGTTWCSWVGSGETMDELMEVLTGHGTTVRGVVMNEFLTSEFRAVLEDVASRVSD